MEFTPFMWLIVALVMALVEVLSLGLLTMWFVIGALVAFVVALVGTDLVVQVVVFLVVSVASLILLRPVILKYRKHGQEAEASVIGSVGVVSETIDADGLAGEVKLANSVSWTARAANGQAIEKGTRVRVVRQESIKVFVEPLEPTK